MWIEDFFFLLISVWPFCFLPIHFQNIHLSFSIWWWWWSILISAEKEEDDDEKKIWLSFEWIDYYNDNDNADDDDPIDSFNWIFCNQLLVMITDHKLFLIFLHSFIHSKHQYVWLSCVYEFFVLFFLWMK